MRCLYAKCHNPATRLWRDMRCFSFCDEHFVSASKILESPVKVGQSKARVSKDAVARGKELLADGVPPKIVAATIGITMETVYRWRREVLGTVGTSLPDDEVERVLELHAQGLSSRQIARKVGRSQPAVLTAIKVRAVVA